MEKAASFQKQKGLGIRGKEKTGPEGITDARDSRRGQPDLPGAAFRCRICARASGGGWDFVGAVKTPRVLATPQLRVGTMWAEAGAQSMWKEWKGKEAMVYAFCLARVGIGSSILGSALKSRTRGPVGVTVKSWLSPSPG